MMTWQVTDAQTEDAWFEEAIEKLLDSPCKHCPPTVSHLGASVVSWHECEPGVAFIEAKGGTPDDNAYAVSLMRSKLAEFGYRQAAYTVDAKDSATYNRWYEESGTQDSEAEEVRLSRFREEESRASSWRYAEAPLEEPVFPTVDDAVGVNQQTLLDHGQTNHALLRPDVLEGALGRAQNYWAYEGDMAKSAAALAHGVGQAQAFEDGNKRTAYHLTHGFLAANGYDHAIPEDDQELADHLIGYGEGTHTMDDTAEMLRQRMGQQRTSMFKQATWDDIMAKAKRLIQSGNVTLLRNGYNAVVGDVVGDHGEYQTEIGRDDPTSRVITQWTCECPWDQYAFQRTRKWKKYEGRPCAHVLATYWSSLSTPLDEDIHPSNGGGGPQGPSGPPPGQMGLPSPEMSGGPPGAQGPQGAPSGPILPAAQPSQQLPIPGMQPPDQGAPGQDIIPPFPMAPVNPDMVPNPVSVPGLRQPSPMNPVQYPGGTFSSVEDGWHLGAQQFEPGSVAVLNKPEIGVAVGKSNPHGAGSWREIPQGARVEVVSQDPTTGFVEIRWVLKTSGPLEPYHVEAFVEPAILRSVDGPNPFDPYPRPR